MDIKGTRIRLSAWPCHLPSRPLTHAAPNTLLDGARFQTLNLYGATCAEILGGRLCIERRKECLSPESLTSRAERAKRVAPRGTQRALRRR